MNFREQFSIASALLFLSSPSLFAANFTVTAKNAIDAQSGIETVTLLTNTTAGTSVGDGGEILGKDLFTTVGSSLEFNIASGPLTLVHPIRSQDGAGLKDLIKSGAGTLVLQGAANYTGNTWILAGTLQGDAMSFQGDITDNGTLVFDQAGTGTYAGAIAGTGNVIKQNGGALILTGANIYSGSTTVSSGTLQGDTASLQGAIVNNGAVTFDQSGSGTYTGAMSGTGSLTKQNSGTVTLGGPNSYSGGTVVAAGSLKGTTISLQGPITNNGDVAFNQPFNGTYTGHITGTGSLTKDGTGTVTMTGSHTQSSIQVLSGKLLFRGPVNAASITVNAGATLGGYGTITSPTVIVDGKLAPGASMGTLSIIGSYVQKPGSTFEIGLDPASSDLLAVSGASGTIQIYRGSTANLLFTPGFYAPGTSYTLMHADGGLAGTFSTVILSNPFIIGNLSYDANNLFFTIQSFTLSQIILKGNAAAAAVCIDEILQLPNTAIENALSGIIGTGDVSAVTDALDQLQPSALKDFTLAEQQNFYNLQSAIQHRTSQFLSKACHEIEHSWGVWTDAFYDISMQKNQAGNVGYQAKTSGGILGFDGKVCRRIYLGINGAYTSSKVDLKRHRGDGHINSCYGGLYIGWMPGHFDIDISTLGTWNIYHTDRHIAFSGVNLHARSEHSGKGFDAGLTLGYTGKIRKFSLRPYGMVNYVYLKESSFKEYGAEELDLKVQQSNRRLIRSEMGLEFQTCYSRLSFLEMSLAWMREMRFGGEEYRTGFKDLSCTFIVKGLNPDRNLVKPMIQWGRYLSKHRVLVTLRYEGEFGEKYQSNTAGLQLAF